MCSNRLVMSVAILATVATSYAAIPARADQVTGHHDAQPNGRGYEYFAGGSVTFADGATFDNNSSCGLSLGPQSSVQITGGTFDDNGATAEVAVRGGVVTMQTVDDSAPVTLDVSGGKFDGNTGAGILGYDIKSTISGGEFDRNSQYGLFASNTDGYMEDTMVQYDSGDSTVSISGGHFDGNTYCGVYAEEKSTLTITGGTFDECGQDGLYLDSSTASICGGSFDSNQHYGVFVAAGSTATITGSAFRRDGYAGIYEQNAVVCIRGGTFGANPIDLYADGGTITLIGSWGPLAGRTLRSGKGRIVGRLQNAPPGLQTITFGTSEDGEILLRSH